MKVKKIPGGLKNKGMKNAQWDKLKECNNESAEKAPHDQMKGGSAKKISKK